MKKYFIIFIFSFSLGVLLAASMAAAKETSMFTYYPSSSGAYTKILLVNGGGGPDENGATPFCLQTAAGYDPTPIVGHTYINAGIIFTDPNSGFMEICKSDGSVASYVGACFNRFTTGAPQCPKNYKMLLGSGQPFPGVTSYSCCFADANTNSYAKSGCFSIFSNGSTPLLSCFKVDPNAYDMGCQSIKTGCSAVRTCCFNSGSPTACNGPCTLNKSSTCPSVGNCCTPDCSCASSTCTNSSCTDPVCGTQCPGTMTTGACSGCTPNGTCTPIFQCGKGPGWDNCGQPCIADLTGEPNQGCPSTGYTTCYGNNCKCPDGTWNCCAGPPPSCSSGQVPICNDGPTWGCWCDPGQNWNWLYYCDSTTHTTCGGLACPPGDGCAQYEAPPGPCYNWPNQNGEYSVSHP